MNANRFSNLAKGEEISPQEQRQMNNKKATIRKVVTFFAFVGILVLLWHLFPVIGDNVLPPFQEAWENLKTGLMPLLRSLFIASIWFSPFILIGVLIFIYCLAKGIGSVFADAVVTSKKDE